MLIAFATASVGDARLLPDAWHAPAASLPRGAV